MYFALEDEYAQLQAVVWRGVASALGFDRAEHRLGPALGSTSWAGQEAENHARVPIHDLMSRLGLPQDLLR